MGKAHSKAWRNMVSFSTSKGHAATPIDVKDGAWSPKILPYP